MSAIEITSKVEERKELEALIEEAKVEAEALRDEIKAEISCVILFIADRVAPAFRFCLDNSTLTQAIPVR